MASLWLSLLTVLSSLFLAGSYKLPTRKLLGQDGARREAVGALATSTAQWLRLDDESSPSPETLDSSDVSTANLSGEEDMEAHRLPAQADSPSAAPRRWEWKATGDGGHQLPQVPHRKRRVAVASPGEAVPVSKGKTAGPSKATATSDTLGATTSGVATMAVARLNSTDGTSPSRAPPLTSSETTGATDRRQPAAKAGPTAPRASSETGTVSSTTEFWAWLHDEVTVSPETFVSTVTLRPGFDTTRTAVRGKGKAAFPLRTATVASTTEWPWLDDESTPSSETPDSANVSTATPSQGLGAAPRARGKSSFPHVATATATSTTEWPWLDDESTSSSETVDSANVSTATPSQGLGAAPRARGKSSFPHVATATATSTTEWPWLDDESTSSSETVDSANVSTATPSQGLGPANPVLSGKGNTTFPPRRAAASTTPAQANPPSAGSLGGTGPLVGKCLLAIFLLALVAGIFIVLTGVLATMLWRQKRAYKMNQQNHTEMVCISSLLATEEAEEQAAGRAPRVKRVRMLGENGSEAEMDNLTLNSFLPEH